MNANAGNVLPKSSLMTESTLKKLISVAVTGVRHRRELTTKDLADKLFCDVGTITNAETGEHKLQPHTLFNLLTIDAFALEGLLHHFGRRSVPIEAKCDTDELVSTARAVSTLAVVKSPDSPGGTTITDHECLDIERDIDAALEALSALKTRCHDIRKGRAA